VIAMTDHAIRIETGKGAAATHDLQSNDIIRQKIAPRLRGTSARSDRRRYDAIEGDGRRQRSLPRRTTTPRSRPPQARLRRHGRRVVLIVFA